MPRLLDIPRQYRLFRSTLNEYLSYRRSPIKLNLTPPNTPFRVLYDYPHEMTFQTTLSIVERPWHPLKILLQRRWDEMPTSGLWIFYNVGPRCHNKAVVRSWNRRRLRRALKEVLEERGMDEEGYPLGNRTAESPIKGSITFHAYPVLTPTNYEEIKKGLGAIVDKIIAVRIKSPRQL